MMDGDEVAFTGLVYPHRAWDPGLDPQAGRGYCAAAAGTAADWSSLTERERELARPGEGQSRSRLCRADASANGGGRGRRRGADAGAVCGGAADGGSLRNKRLGLSGRPPCKVNQAMNGRGFEPKRWQLDMLRGEIRRQRMRTCYRHRQRRHSFRWPICRLMCRRSVPAYKG